LNFNLSIGISSSKGKQSVSQAHYCAPMELTNAEFGTVINDLTSPGKWFNNTILVQE
jgi:hypothetical protein